MDIPILLALIASLGIIVYLVYSSVINKKTPSTIDVANQQAGQEVRQVDEDEVEVVQVNY
jgi:hypothetical protein